MFIGHLAVGFASKKAAPRTSLATLLLAPCFVDVLWCVFILAGVEQARVAPGYTRVVPFQFISYPWSHSLAMDAVWAAAFGGVYLAATGYRRGAWVVALAVLSHWPLDVVSHAHDMPLAPGIAAKVGWGLYDSLPGTLAVEGALFAAGLWLYARVTRPMSRAATWNLAAFVTFILASFSGATFAPPAPDMRVVAAVNLMILPALLWAAWIDTRREVVS